MITGCDGQHWSWRWATAGADPGNQPFCEIHTTLHNYLDRTTILCIKYVVCKQHYTFLTLESSDQILASPLWIPTTHQNNWEKKVKVELFNWQCCPRGNFLPSAVLHKYGIATHFLSVSFPRVFPGYVNEDGELKLC